MGRSTFILFPALPDAASWTIAAVATGAHRDAARAEPITVPQGLDAAATIAAVAEALKRLSPGRSSVILALPAAWCLAATVPTGGLPRRDRKAVLYRLEEKLPLAAEDVVADFVAAPSAGDEGTTNDHVLGVCARLETVRPIVDALERTGVTLLSIMPAAFLGAQGLLEARPPAQRRERWTALIFGEAGQLSLLALRDQMPTAWLLLPATGADVALALDVLAVEGGPDAIGTIVGCDVPGELRDVLAQPRDGSGPPDVTMLPETLVSAAARSRAVIDGRTRPWVDLRRGPLAPADRLSRHRRPLNACLAAAAALLLAASLAMLLRSVRYDGQARAAERQMADEFRAAFPGWQVPANVRSVVESERRKLAAAGSRVPGAPAGSGQASALGVLHDVLSKLPPDLPLRVGRMSFGDRSFEIEGQLRSFDDADAIAAAARRAGLDVPPPLVRKDGDGLWAFTVRGSRPAGPSPTPAARPEPDGAALRGVEPAGARHARSG